MKSTEPMFTVIDPSTGHKWEIYSNGHIEGFGSDRIILNRIPFFTHTDQWQPIDTIPKEYMHDILLWNGNKFIGWLNDDGWHDSSNRDYDDEAENPQPTHWMRIEAPNAGVKR